MSGRVRLICFCVLIGLGLLCACCFLKIWQYRSYLSDLQLVERFRNIEEGLYVARILKCCDTSTNHEAVLAVLDVLTERATRRNLGKPLDKFEQMDLALVYGRKWLLYEELGKTEQADSNYHQSVRAFEYAGLRPESEMSKDQLRLFVRDPAAWSREKAGFRGAGVSPLEAASRDKTVP